ncbi:HAD-IIB family hydrolase [Carnimonas nigrificans]|uniref:HAD-IIB family hydrolase n=1 Tax=Carnimonas nigrificans TaxID=64323 RepID=UPI00047233A9|nr:HAD-IIB family hydrolase [Carnimonas nigrificans]
MNGSSLLVFTDLDGSLLDHHSYSWAPAAHWLEKLRRAQVPLIINSSKTRAEVSALSLELGICDAPCIVENGAAILLPPRWQQPGEGDMITLGADIAHIRHALAQLRDQGFSFEGFGDVSPQRVAEWTGLPLAQAQLAWQREATEPLFWHEDEQRLDAFTQALAQHQLTTTRGGRFVHVMAAQADKGRALLWLKKRFAQLSGNECRCVALGDGANDIPMLNAAEMPVLIRNDASLVQLPAELETRCYLTQQAGPSGWNEGLDHWLGSA